MVSGVLRSQSLCTCCVMNAEGREERVSLGTNMELLSMELVCTWASLLDQNTHSERNVGFSGPLRDWDFFFFCPMASLESPSSSFKTRVVPE